MQEQQDMGTSVPDPETYALGLMVEEMGETLKLIGKAMRFGLDTPGPASPEYRGLSAREMLPFEVGDLHAAIRYAAMAGVVRMSAANVAEEAKLAKLLSPLSRDAQGNRLAPDVSAGRQASPKAPPPSPTPGDNNG